MGANYFQKLSDEEFMQVWQSACYEHKGVHDMNSLLRFMCDEQTITIPLDTVQYRIILMPDFDAESSAIVLKINHTLGDGAAIVYWVMALADIFDPDNVPVVKHYPFWLKLATKLATPFTTLYYSLEMIFMHRDKNAICNGRTLTGNKNAATTTFDIN